MALNYSVFNWAVGFPATRALLGFLLFAQAELSEEMHRVQEMFKMSENPLIRLSAVVGLAESGGFFLELRLCLVRDVLKSNVKTRKPQLEVSGASGRRHLWLGHGHQGFTGRNRAPLRVWPWGRCEAVHGPGEFHGLGTYGGA